MPNRKLPSNDEVIAMYRGGMSTSEIAEATGTKPVTVVDLLRRIGEPRRSNSEAHKLAIAKGRVHPPAYYLRGRKQSPELVEKRVSKIRGENHWLYKDGRSTRHYRDGVVKTECAQCHSTERLVIHHRDLDHYNNESSNLQVLCSSCHQSLHKAMYWEAKREGRPTPRSNGPIGWEHKT